MVNSLYLPSPYQLHVPVSVLSAASWRPAVHLLLVDAGKMTIQTFVSSCLDYCNSVMYGITDDLMQRFKTVQNAAARVVTGT